MINHDDDNWNNVNDNDKSWFEIMLSLFDIFVELLLLYDFLIADQKARKLEASCLLYCYPGHENARDGGHQAG